MADPSPLSGPHAGAKTIKKHEAGMQSLINSSVILVCTVQRDASQRYLNVLV